MTRKVLDRAKDVISQIHKRFPQAQLSILPDTLEDVDAIILARVPSEEMAESLRDFTGELTYNLLVDEGLNFIVWIHDLEDNRVLA